MKKILLVAGVFIVLLTAGYTFITLGPEEDLIVGTWIMEDEWGSDSKLVFMDDGRVEEYSEGILFWTYNWTIYKETSPVCGVEVQTEPRFSYLKKVNVAYPNDIYCYEIMLLDEETLQLRYFERYTWTSYTRQ